MEEAFWRQLVEPDGDCESPLSCRQCLAIFAFLADLATLQVAADPGTKRALAAAIRRHLACCPDCQQTYADHLESMEQLAQRGGPDSVGDSP